MSELASESSARRELASESSTRREPGLSLEALRGFLAAVEPDRGATVTAFRPITGGYSRCTAVADIRWADGAEERVVLRGDPAPGDGVFESDRDAEWALVQALHRSGHVRVPRPRWYEATGAHFGTKTIVVDHVAGRPLRDVLRSTEDTGAAARTFVDAVARIHATPLAVLPAVVDRPTDWTAYVDGVLALYRGVDAEVGDSDPLLRHVAAKLARAKPAPVPFVLVHGDCQPSNMLVGGSGDPVVIDWEFARVGDPREDLGYYTQIPIAPNVYAGDPEGFLARYRERTGLSEEQVNPRTVEWFLVVGMARLLVQILRALDAVARGGTRGVLATYLVNAVSHQHRLFLDVCGRVA